MAGEIDPPLWGSKPLLEKSDPLLEIVLLLVLPPPLERIEMASEPTLDLSDLSSLFHSSSLANGILPSLSHLAESCALKSMGILIDGPTNGAPEKFVAAKYSSGKRELSDSMKQKIRAEYEGFGGSPDTPLKSNYFLNVMIVIAVLALLSSLVMT